VKNLFLLLLVCMVSMLAVAQTDSTTNSVDQHGSAQISPAGWATLNPMNWALGDVPVESGNFQAFVVSNGSSANITITDISLSPSSSPSFFLTSPSSCEGTLQSGEFCYITAGFYATARGAASATLRVHTSAGVLPANMTATAVMDNVTLSTLDCGGVPQMYFPCRVDMELNPRATVTLTNNQGTRLTINNIMAQPSLFNLLPASTCPLNGGTVPAQGSCTIVVQYTGNPNAPVTGTLKVTDDAADQTPYYINLCHKLYCQ
jgi:hypothetical protein